MKDAYADEHADSTIGSGGWPLTLALCTVFSVIGAFWLKWATFPELSAGLCEAIPPIPAIATLIFLIGVRGLLGLFSRRFGLSRKQIVTVYAFVSISVPLGFVNLYRQTLVLVTAPSYGTGANLQELKDYVPHWLAPTQEAVVRQFWEGSPTGSVPWGAWLVPMLSIGGTLLLFYMVIICMLRLFYKRWSSEERLIWPVAQLPWNMVEEPARRQEGGTGAIFRGRIFWIGAASALLFNLIYIIPALHRYWPMPPAQINLAGYLVDPPWNAAGMWIIRFNIVVFGLGFLVSTDVLLSIWVGFLLLKAEAIFLGSRGVPRMSLFLIEGQQGIGAYAAVALFMIWAARRHILGALRSVLPGTRSADPEAAGRWTVLFLAGGIAALLVIMTQAGMVLWLAAAFLVVLLVRSLVLARIRSQAGIPNIYLGVGSVRHMMWLLGGALVASSGMRSAAGLTLMAFVISMFATNLVPHHVDALYLADRCGVGIRRWMWVALFGVIVGLVLVNLTHLTAFYSEGALNVQAADLRSADWRASHVIDPVRRSAPPEKLKQVMAGTGFLTTCILTYLRRFYWFPFHPLGFVVACAGGAYLFGPILLIWFIKWTILRYFGGEIYRKARSYFLGLVMGHFGVASIWGVLAAFGWPPTDRYFVGFW